MLGCMLRSTNSKSSAILDDATELQTTRNKRIQVCRRLMVIATLLTIGMVACGQSLEDQEYSDRPPVDEIALETSMVNATIDTPSTTTTTLVPITLTEAAPVSVGVTLVPQTSQAVKTESQHSVSSKREMRTYRNVEYGFRLEYPTSWVVSSPAYGTVLSGPERIGNEHLVLGLSSASPHGDWPYIISATRTTFESLVRDPEYRWLERGDSIQRKEAIVIGQLPAIAITWSNGATVLYLEHPEEELVISFDGFGGYDAPENVARDELSTIVDSFRFDR